MGESAITSDIEMGGSDDRKLTESPDHRPGMGVDEAKAIESRDHTAGMSDGVEMGVELGGVMLDDSGGEICDMLFSGIGIERRFSRRLVMPFSNMDMRFDLTEARFEFMDVRGGLRTL